MRQKGIKSIMFTLFLAGILCVFYPMYRKNPQDWDKILAFSVTISLIGTFWIWLRCIPPEIVNKAMDQGNGYLLFT